MVVAVPVASPEAAYRLRHVAADVKVLSEEPYFHAVGQFYDEFFPTEDEEVIGLLKEAAAMKA